MSPLCIKINTIHAIFWKKQNKILFVCTSIVLKQRVLVICFSFGNLYDFINKILQNSYEALNYVTVNSMISLALFATMLPPFSYRERDLADKLLKNTADL